METAMSLRIRALPILKPEDSPASCLTLTVFYSIKITRCSEAILPNLFLRHNFRTDGIISNA